jgi:1L-myo-inositol 1-phosphate cytidylyltransferase / CDP-L-myo-inositol myo-inositolphosphotransferase
MSPLTHTKKSVAEDKSLYVVIISNPPAPWKVTDWYWKEIAGVPFLLRNILSIQQAGARRLMLFADKNVVGFDELYRRVANDSRIRLQLEWDSKPEKLIVSAENDNCILFLDGSALQNKARIAKTLKLDPEENTQESDRNLFLSPSHLETLLQQIDERGLVPWLKNIQSQNIPQEISPNPGINIKWVTETENLRITRPEDFKTMDNRLIQSCGLSNDSFMDRSVTRFISRQLTRQIIKTPVTPNMITLVSLIIGLGAAACFLAGSYAMGVAGAGLLLLSTWVDCTDGEVARLKFLESPFGKQLDIICDNIVHMAVFFSIGLGLRAATGNDFFIVLGGFAVLGCLVSFILLSQEIVNSKMNCDEYKPNKAEKKSITDKLANRDFTYFLFFMAVIAQLELFLALTAAGSNIFSGYLLYNKFRIQRKP